MDAAAIHSIASRLIDAQDRAATIAPIAATAPGFDVDAAYDVLLEIESRRVAQGWRPVGRKIGFTNRTIWPRYGVYQPMGARVWSHTVHYGSHPAAIPDIRVLPCALTLHRSSPRTWSRPSLHRA